VSPYRPIPAHNTVPEKLGAPKRTDSIGGKSAIARLPTYLALEPLEYRHHNKCGDCDGDAAATRFRPNAARAKERCQRHHNGKIPAQPLALSFMSGKDGTNEKSATLAESNSTRLSARMPGTPHYVPRSPRTTTPHIPLPSMPFYPQSTSDDKRLH
jgi:hypothetical protein